MPKEMAVEEENHKMIHALMKACSRYAITHKNESVMIPSDYSGQVSDNDLIKLSFQMYIDRFHGIVKTLQVLSPDINPNTLLENELSVGILLRSCILDCFDITVWLFELYPMNKDGFRDHNKKGDISWLSKIFSSSFSYAPKPPQNLSDNELERDFYPTVRKNFLNQAKYFRVDLSEAEKMNEKNLKQKISSDDILKRLEEIDAPMIRRLHDLYTYYSKYDHFSPIPYLIPSTRDSSLSRINLSLRFIKHTITEMLVRSEDPYANEICEILDVTIAEP